MFLMSYSTIDWAIYAMQLFVYILGWDIINFKLSISNQAIFWLDQKVKNLNTLRTERPLKVN